MPQFTTPLVIKDGSATPADVSYSPELLSSGETILVDRREASRDLQPALAIGFSRPLPQRQTFKVQVDAALPLKREVAGVMLAEDVGRAKCAFTLPKNMTAAERKHLRAMIANAIDHAYITAQVENLDPLY